MVQTTFLYYLTRVAHYQSLSIAAEELHVSQPALSQGIKTLEKQLGAKLLERTYKGVTLTEEGKEVVALAEKAFETLGKIETLYRQPSEKENDTLNDLTIYCNPAYSSLVMSALSESNNSEKNVIQLFELTSDIDPEQLLASNRNIVILGIVSDLHPLPNSSLSIKILRSSKTYIACSNDFPYIAANKATISLKELTKIPLAISTNALEFQKELLKGVQQYGKPNIKVFAPNYLTVNSATRSGIAASFSNKFYDSPEDDILKHIPIRNTPNVHLSLVYSHQLDVKKIDELAKLLDPYLI